MRREFAFVNSLRSDRPPFYNCLMVSGNDLFPIFTLTLSENILVLMNLIVLIFDQAIGSENMPIFDEFNSFAPYTRPKM
ncbi:hypothetical protein RhiirC2_802297 [Rhizophagus irregularis]|uniref:Uncharacterized protein n=1 Tax=Rhizophagus irregularis TaxID=588596 RepID=A0A2N1M1H4_9GLOM|nr:hypothetical protein RhiirC2_802297 [Rhizophagus irregularis]